MTFKNVPLVSQDDFPESLPMDTWKVSLTPSHSKSQKKAKNFCSSPENYTKNTFSWKKSCSLKCPYGHGRCSSDTPANKISDKMSNFFRPLSKNVAKKFSTDQSVPIDR